MALVLAMLALIAAPLSWLWLARGRTPLDDEGDSRLAQARDALIAYALQTTFADSERPGTLPFPDQLSASESPAQNYDGTTNQACLDSAQPDGYPLINTVGDPNGLRARCLGRLPWRDIGFRIPGASQVDLPGDVPWYALSRNLLNFACTPLLNPDTAALAPSQAACPNPDGRPYYPWLTLRDSNGALVSDRVAALLILPGPPIGSQARTAAPLKPAGHYLDALSVGGSVRRNDDMDEDFVRSADNQPAKDASGAVAFNDRVAHITIDELMGRLARSGFVQNQLIRSIEDYRTAYGTYPWLAPFADPTLDASYLAVAGTTDGLLPLRAIGEYTPTPFTWSISGAATIAYSASGTVASADVAAQLSGAATADNGRCRIDGQANPERRVDCVKALTAGLPAGVARRQISLRFRATASGVTITADSATATRSRRVSRTGSYGLAGTTQLAFDLTDYNAASDAVGSAGIDSGNGTVTASGIRESPLAPAGFVSNGWHRLARVRIASGFAPGAAQNCAAPGACLSILKDGQFQYPPANQPQAYATAAALYAGPALSGSPTSQLRPSGNLADYYEGANRTTGATTLERRRTDSAFNDALACSYLASSSPVAIRRCQP